MRLGVSRSDKETSAVANSLTQVHACPHVGALYRTQALEHATLIEIAVNRLKTRILEVSICAKGHHL